MGNNQRSSYSLIAMTNNDVYYITPATAKVLMEVMQRLEQPTIVVVTDAKSGATVAIAISNISSIVVNGGRDA